MGLVGKTNEEKIWNYLKAAGLSDCGVAGLMGNLFAESALIPTNLQNTYERSLGFTDAEYTAAVDDGSYSNFVRDSAGYGLAQWTYWSRKQNLLEYAKQCGKSIGDLEMQLAFLVKELAGYTGVLSVLKTATTVQAASDKVLVDFERPADQSQSAKTRRASYGQKYYDKYAGGGTATTTTPATGGRKMTAKELVAKAIDIAKNHNTGCGLIRCNESGLIVRAVYPAAVSNGSCVAVIKEPLALLCDAQGHNVIFISVYVIYNESRGSEGYFIF